MDVLGVLTITVSLVTIIVSLITATRAANRGAFNELKNVVTAQEKQIARLELELKEEKEEGKKALEALNKKLASYEVRIAELEREKSELMDRNEKLSNQLAEFMLSQQTNKE